MDGKKRVAKAYENLSEDIQNLIKLKYPRGFAKHLIKYPNKDGLMISALPFETEDTYYMVKMSIAEAKQIILDDDDYEDGILRENFEEDMDLEVMDED